MTATAPLERSMASRIKAEPGSTVDAAEVARFSAYAAEWWDPRGRMAMLHKFNPVRLAFIKQSACRHFDRDERRLDALAGLRVLDIGCGGGILSEPLARLGAEVVGADPSQTNIEAAKLHASEAGVVVDYRATTAEALADEGERFDVVLAMEVVEHVADLGLFISRCAEMVRPGGLMITATLNRTLKSFALAIVGAEYVLRWLPRGTHQWEKFVTPNELEAALERHGLRAIDETGVIYNLLADRWQLSTDMDVNYMVVAERAPS
jgi:2-polyprenyl-6-hydroxyphenyl methylase/3-demethylubiquinone-9 3-methyltransferase